MVSMSNLSRISPYSNGDDFRACIPESLLDAIRDKLTGAEGQALHAIIYRLAHRCLEVGTKHGYQMNTDKVRSELEAAAMVRVRKRIEYALEEA